MKTKICPKCKKEKSVDYFYKDKKTSDSLSYQCKECIKRHSRERRKNNPEKVKEENKEWRKNNPKYGIEWKKKNPEYHREYDQKPDVKKRKKEWYQNHKEEINKRSKKYQKNKSANDPRYRLDGNIATAIWFALKGNKAGRKWETLVGYTLQNLIDRLSVNFQIGMTWNNYGDWHIDHSKPQSLFNYTKPEDQAFRDCWSLANLQPMWAEDNLSKGNKF